MITGQSLSFSGKIDYPLHIKDSRGVTLYGVETELPVHLENCTDVRIVDSALLKGTVLQGVFNCEVEDTHFSANGEDRDACMVMGRQQKVSKHSYLDFNNPGRAINTEKLAYGRPDAFNRGNIEWHRTVSDRTGQEVWKGIDRLDNSQDVSFKRCSFENSQRAGLFIHHTDGYLVEDCTGENTRDYPLGSEWTRFGTWRRNKASQIVSHYYNISSLYEENEVTWGINIYSQGDPVKNLIIRKNKSFSDQKDGGRIMLRNGQFFGWSAGAWFEDVHITENEANYVFVAAGDFQGKPTPEIMPRNIFITNNNLKGGTYPAEIHLQSVDGYLLEGNTGKVRDYTAGGRVPSRPLVSDPAG